MRHVSALLAAGVAVPQPRVSRVHTPASSTRSVNSITNSSVNDENETKNSDTTIHFNQEQMKFIATMAKFTCLVSTTVISTLLMIIVTIMSAMNPDSYYIISFGIMQSTIDATINSIVLLLHLPFAKKFYHILCSPCNKLMIQKCSNNVENYLQKHDASETQL